MYCIFLLLVFEIEFGIKKYFKLKIKISVLRFNFKKGYDRLDWNYGEENFLGNSLLFCRSKEFFYIFLRRI